MFTNLLSDVTMKLLWMKIVLMLNYMIFSSLILLLKILLGRYIMKDYLEIITYSSRRLYMPLPLIFNIILNCSLFDLILIHLSLYHAQFAVQFAGKFLSPCSYATISYTHTGAWEPHPHSERPPTLFSAFICEGLNCAILQLNKTKIAQDLSRGGKARLLYWSPPSVIPILVSWKAQVVLNFIPFSSIIAIFRAGTWKAWMYMSVSV